MLNKVTLIGNLGADPVVREAGEDRKVANVRLASRRRWRGRDGNCQEDTQWHQLVFWGHQAELAEQLLNKGQLVYVEGRLNTTNWVDQEDREHTHYRTEVVAESFLILSPKDVPLAEAEIQV